MLRWRYTLVSCCSISLSWSSEMLHLVCLLPQRRRLMTMIVSGSSTNPGCYYLLCYWWYWWRPWFCLLLPPLLLLPINDAFKATSTAHFIDTDTMGSARKLNCNHFVVQIKVQINLFRDRARESSWNRDGRWKLIHWIRNSCTFRYRLSGVAINARKI